MIGQSKNPLGLTALEEASGNKDFPDLRHVDLEKSFWGLGFKGLGVEGLGVLRLGLRVSDCRLGLVLPFEVAQHRKL